MKQYKYIGLFISSTEHWYTHEVHCNGFIQAFFLLTDDAIRSGRHYQLHTIEDEDGCVMYVEDILKISDVLILYHQNKLQDDTQTKKTTVQETK